MSGVKSVLKKFPLLKRLWNEIVQTVAYVKNYTIIQSANDITQYKRVNESFASVASFCVVGCRCYSHFLDITIRQTMYDNE